MDGNIGGPANGYCRQRIRSCDASSAPWDQWNRWNQWIVSDVGASTDQPPSCCCCLVLAAARCATAPGARCCWVARFRWSCGWSRQAGSASARPGQSIRQPRQVGASWRWAPAATATLKSRAVRLQPRALAFKVLWALRWGLGWAARWMVGGPCIPCFCSSFRTNPEPRCCLGAWLPGSWLGAQTGSWERTREPLPLVPPPFCVPR